MATRLFIVTDAGEVLDALDGHHGNAHALAWALNTLQRRRAEGFTCDALELIPEQGGDIVRRGVVGSIHRLRAQFHRRPDGARELVGLALAPELRPDEPGVAAVGIGRGLGKRQAAAAPLPVRGALRVVVDDSLPAPASPILAPRARLDRRTRLDPPPGAPRTPADRRHARRLQRARERTP